MQELLYTSVPRGLKPGSRGFCTVLSTQGMVAPLAAALEGLSGYRPVFPLGHERVAENPIVYSHLKLQVAGKSWHVLSRIADYGLDYSQRTNKLAHHLVLDKSELPAAGPASLLRVAGIMRESWEGDPKIVPPKPISRQPSAPSGVCQAWKEMTGDAGWAGVLAESFLKDPNRPVILLFEPGQDLRPLMDESLSLLPPERRWDVTFSTYFTGSSQGITCLWRGIAVGSKEASESLRFVNALRIDLTSADFSRAEGGELVDAARKGVRPSARPVSPPKQTASREQQEPRVVLMDDSEQQTNLTTASPIATTRAYGSPVADNDKSQAPPVLTRSAFRFARDPSDTDEGRSRPSKSWWSKFIIPLIMALLIVCVLVMIAPIVQKMIRDSDQSKARSLAASDPIAGATPTTPPAATPPATTPPATTPPATTPPATPQPSTPRITFLDKAIRVASTAGEDSIQLKQSVATSSVANQTWTLRLVPPRPDFPIRGSEPDANKLPILCTAKVAGGNPETKQFAELRVTASSELVFKRTDNHGSEKAAANLSLCLIELSVPGSSPQLIALNSNETASVREKDGIFTVISDRLKYANDANVALSLHDLVIKYHHDKRELTEPDQTMPTNKGRLLIPALEDAKKIEIVVRLGKPDSQSGQVSLHLMTEPTKADTDKELTDKVDELKVQLEELIRNLKVKKKDEDKAREKDKEKKLNKYEFPITELEKILTGLRKHERITNDKINAAVADPDVRTDYNATKIPETIKVCESLLAHKDLVDSLAKAKVFRATVKYEVKVHEGNDPISVDLLKIRGN